MTKKKHNRKKALKHKQREVEDSLAQLKKELKRQPVFVERRLAPAFDEQHTAIFQYYEEYEEHPDHHELNVQLKSGTFPWKKEHALFQQALRTSAKGKKRKLLEQILAIAPDYFAAEFQLFLMEVEPFNLETYMKTLEFEQRVISQWKAVGYGDWYVFEARPILTGLSFLLDYYMNEGFYAKALSLIDMFLSKNPKRYPPNFVFQMLSLYHMTGQEQKVESYCRQEWRLGNFEDTTLVHAVISSVLKGNIDKAIELFVQLSELNPEAVDFFANEDWVYELVEIEQMDTYLPNTAQSLQASLYPLMSFLETNTIVADFLLGTASEIQEFEMFKNSGAEKEVLHALTKLDEWYSLMAEPKMKGIRMDYARILCEDGGIKTVADFKKKTEKEILSLKGIGQSTLKKLKENGITFKESKKGKN